MAKTPVAILTLNRRLGDMDTLIVWEQDGALTAYAYKDARVVATRPLVEQQRDYGVAEARVGLGIADGEVATSR